MKIFFRNDILFPRNVLLVSTFESNLSVNFIKNMLSNNNIEKESTLKRIIEYVKKVQLKEQKDSLVKNIIFEKISII